MITRTTKISLAEYEPTWANSHVVVRVQSFQEMTETLESLTKLIEKKQAGLPEAQALLEIVEKSVVGGMIFDSELNAERELGKADIKNLPLDVIRDLSGYVMGTKKK